MKRGILIGLGVLLIAAATQSARAGDKTIGADAYYDLGGFHFAVTTESKEAQKWFDRGLAMCHGFNHEEGVRCFEKAIAADPAMAMAYWGLAYAWGPYINNMEIDEQQMAKASLAIRLAELHLSSCTPKEKGLIRALAARYASPVPEDREPLNRAYADAMRNVYDAHVDDPLVTSLFAESLMNLQPWKHWMADGKPGPYTEEIVRVLEAGLERWPDYPALAHFYIHAIEASPHPERALPAAERLRTSMPGQGHLVHMPTHIDIRLGDYARVIEENRKAIAIDEEFLRREGAHNFYTYYRVHNYHFLVYGAMFDGQSNLALETARAIPQQIPEDMLRKQTDFLDAFMSIDMHVLVRFGRWDEILKQPKPADFLPASRSVWHYARALALAATDQVEQSEAEQIAFLETKESVPETSFLFQNACRDILGVAESMIAGEIAYRKGDFKTAFEHLREAVRRDDALNYDEPWGWMQPARHALGALLLERGRHEEAEQVYRKDLERHPHNPWALHGLAECLEALGNHDELSQVRNEFQLACKRSDVEIDRSCYCRLED